MTNVPEMLSKPLIKVANAKHRKHARVKCARALTIQVRAGVTEDNFLAVGSGIRSALIRVEGRCTCTYTHTNMHSHTHTHALTHSISTDTLAQTHALIHTHTTFAR